VVLFGEYCVVLSLDGDLMPRTDFVYLEIDGKRATTAYWARHFGIEYAVFKMRYHRHGLDLAKLCAPVQKRSKRRKTG